MKNSYLESFIIQPKQTSLADNFSQNLAHSLKKLNWLSKSFTLKKHDELLSEINVSVTQFRLAKLIGMLIGAVATLSLAKVSGLSFSSLFLIVLSITGGFAGFIVPELYISDRLKTKRFFIHHAVPDFLDQFHLLVSSPAYESFGKALQYIAPSFPGYLGDELRKLARLQPFLSEQELLNQLETACNHSLITELATTVRVSSQFGSSLKDKTGQLLSTAQLQREHSVKDLGNKTSGMLLGPLLLFHLPALLIIFLIPFVFILQKGF